jgi:hypothetical protein
MGYGFPHLRVWLRARHIARRVIEANDRLGRHRR